MKQLSFERSEIEIHRMTKENLKMAADVKVLADSLKAETDLKLEYKKALDDNEIVQELKSTVDYISGMLVASTANKDIKLNPQQKKTMQAIFGDTSTLQTIKLRLSQSEQYGEKLGQMVLELQKASTVLKSRLSELWKDLGLVIKNFNEVPIGEINHYQILVLKNMVDDKYSADHLVQLEALLEADLLKFKEVNKQVQGFLLLEEINQR